MVKVFAYLSVFAATTFCITSAAKLNQRAIYNMMNDRAAKDQYHVAVSNEYSARDEATVAFQSSKAYPRALKRVGDKVLKQKKELQS
jgi:dTDP-4-dehydrorhamnose reductase